MSETAATTEDSTHTPAGQPNEPPATPAATERPTGQQAATQPAQQAETPAPPWGNEENFDAERAWTLIQNLRGDIDQLKQTKDGAGQEAVADLRQQLGKALGLVDDGEQAPTVESLTEQVTEATTGREQAEARATEAERRLTVFLNAGDADPNRLLKYTDFLDAIRDLNPDDEEGIKAAITETVTANPWLRKTQAVGASSVDHPAGSGEGAITREKFQAMAPAQRNELLATNPTLYRQLTGRD